ncbi:hypothetical protein LIER_15742 [Lithospermum erythrorhizon]|uniref:Uncharacterized protein n=1 Tax=Lithospermum erythrorhizon TaxID=34254 RepID=A0AAV3Q6M7_LITER
MGLTTKGSSWGNSNPASFLFEKLISPLSRVVAGEPKAYTAPRAYLLLALEVSPPPAIPPEMVSTLTVTRRELSLPLSYLRPFPCFRGGDSLYLRGDPI